MDFHNAPLDPRLQNALFGLPLLRPDEQHRYLGTFRERVDVCISFTQAWQRDFVTELQIELAKVPNAQLLLHGKLDADLLSHYLHFAQQQQLPFSIKTDLYYHHEHDDAAIILCADCPLNYADINIVTRFPEPIEQIQRQSTKSWLPNLFNRKKS
ncbi:hypothetical protein MUDAN_BIHEEGNE_02455 [Lactiplantibacillus mudanjiangensis]|uniref:YueI family protein n=1 Tax=Lactiplantibacillus mudanjiangensis TaxID=1296538 RepID=UPI001015852D|nr:YueI family protein [Lactiplantibacillus mudanjiangensis]VDG20823.1 hypothetical protein MUDAN_BIHEEGNE_02455 [Lactiplantibacillus mudanjiangensis]VDG32048.1 hypothetical protein MUDAN_DOGOELCO_01339 [Lactiplantibacillus mudanjiangensis]